MRVLHFVLAGHGNVPRGEQRRAEDDGTHGVFIGGVARALVVVGHRVQLVVRDKRVERHGGARGAAQLLGRAVGLHIEAAWNSATRRAISASLDLGAKRAQLIHFQQLHVRAEGDRDQRHIGHDVEHAAVVVAHQPQPRRCQRSTHARRGQPLLDLAPGCGLVQHAGHLVKRNARAREDIRDLRHRARRAEGEPLAGHGGAIVQPVESLVVDGRSG